MSDASHDRGSPVALLGGGIGAGKSRVAAVFAASGFTVIETDEVGRAVLERGSPAVESVSGLWPDTVSDGVVDRAALAQVVFSDPEALQRLEAITHPEIGRRVRDLVDAAPGPVVVEVPVMKVLAAEPYIRVAVVANPRVREERAVARGGERGDVRRRMANQPDDDDWKQWADFVIDNSDPWDTTHKAAETLVDEVLAHG